MQLVETVYGNDEPQKSTTEAEGLLTKYPDLRGIIAPTTVGIAAAAQAVETAKVADRVQVIGLGTPNPVSYTHLVRPFNMAWLTFPKTASKMDYFCR